jgi:ketosteroid isomerase-like protein
MSEENVEIVRRYTDAWSRHDRTELARYLHPDAVFHSAETDLFGETFHGRDEILAIFDRWREEWSAVRFELDECIEVDEGRVLTFHKVIATGRRSGVEVVRELASVMDIREGLVVRDWIYRDRDEALEAAGLRE